MNIIELIKKFPNQETCLKHLEKVRWGNKPICVYCNSDKVCKHTEKNKERFQCWNCKKSFSVTVGTIFHRTHIELQKWFLVMLLMLNAKKKRFILPNSKRFRNETTNSLVNDG